MLIKDIKDPAIRALALLRLEEYSSIRNENIQLYTAFPWSKTPEGDMFWVAVDLDFPKEQIKAEMDIVGFDISLSDTGEVIVKNTNTGPTASSGPIGPMGGIPLEVPSGMNSFTPPSGTIVIKEGVSGDVIGEVFKKQEGELHIESPHGNSFFNTVGIEGEELKEAESKAKSQDKRIKEIIDNLPKEAIFTSSQIHGRLRGLDTPLLTSIRRSITNLKKKGMISVEVFGKQKSPFNGKEIIYKKL